MQTVTIIGVGRIGGSLALSLPSDRYEIVSLVTRNGQSSCSAAVTDRIHASVAGIEEIGSISSDIVIIATPDTAIRSVVEAIADKLRDGTIVFHTSGALPSSILSDVVPDGVGTGSVHPLASISRITTEYNPFEGTYFGIEGTMAAVLMGKQISADLGGVPVEIAADGKYLYHAAAVMAAGHLVALLSAAFSAMERSGAAAVDAKAMLLPLIETTVRNLRDQHPSDALTGTFARADTEIAKRHVRALREKCPPEVTRLYLELGSYSLDLALEKGVDPKAVEELREFISMEMGRLE